MHKNHYLTAIKLICVLAFAHSAFGMNVQSAEQFSENKLNIQFFSPEAEAAGVPKKVLNALCNDHVEVLQQMLDDGQLTCQTLVHDDCVPLHCCALFGSVKCGQLLLTRGAFRRVYDKAGINLTGIAAINNCVEFLQMLKKNGFSLTEVDLHNIKPLTHACIYKAMDAACYLVEEHRNEDAFNRGHQEMLLSLNIN